MTTYYVYRTTKKGKTLLFSSKKREEIDLFVQKFKKKWAKLRPSLSIEYKK